MGWRDRWAGPVPSHALTYGILLAASGAYVPYLTLHLQDLGWTAASVGLALAAVAVVRTLAGPVVGWLSDRLGRDELLFPLLTSASALAIAGIAVTRDPRWALCGLLVVAATRAPASVVLDASSLRALRAAGRPLADYGRIRLVGSLGYLLAAAAAGLVVGAHPGAAIAAGAALLSLASLRGGRLARADARVVHGGPSSTLGTWWHDRSLVLLLAAGALHGVSLHAFDAWFPALLVARGWPVAWTGVALTVAIGAEILAMANATWLRHHASTGALLTGAGLIAGLRLLATALASAPWLVLSVQVLHGVALGVWWVAAVEATSERAPAGQRAAVQASLTAATYGIGPMLSGLLSMHLVVGDDPTGLFVAGAACAFVGAAISAIAHAPQGVPLGASSTS